MEGLNVGRKVVVRKLICRKVQVKTREKKNVNKRRPDEESSNEQEDVMIPGVGDSSRTRMQCSNSDPLDDRDFEAWLDELRRRRTKICESTPSICVLTDPSLADGYTHRTAGPLPRVAACSTKSDGQSQLTDPKSKAECRADPSLADGYTHLSNTWLELNQGRTRGTPPMATTDTNLANYAQNMRLYKIEAACRADPSLADGYTHLSNTLLELNQGRTRSTPPMATTDTNLANYAQNMRLDKYEVLMSLVAALLFVINGCLVLSFSSSEANGALFAPIVCLFTAGYVVLILYDIISKSLRC